ncbi:MAG: hypothetical protein ACFFD9_10425, partial [Candidatus Thorarchaeota archaeon]
NDVWHWDAPYNFIVTVFRMLSLVFFFVAFTMTTGTAAAIMGTVPNELIVGLYNTIVLRLWYMQPYGVSGPITDINQVFSRFTTDIFLVIDSLIQNTFPFVYFLCAGVGVALFLQSLVRMEHKFVGGAFIAIQMILVIATFKGTFSAILGPSIVPDYTVFPSDFIEFLGTNIQLLALVSFAYLELSYQMIYSYSVGKPVEDREETLKKQLLALRQATRKQDAIEKGEKVSSTAMSRTTGAIAFSFLREAIERKVVGSQDALENLDAVSDVRRLQIYVDDLLQTDSRARDELTAKAAAPSSSYVIGSTVMGSVIRFLSVVAISFILMSPSIIAIINLPEGIQNSVEILQPEIVLLFLVPVVFLFPFAAMVISWFSKREVLEETELTKAEKEEAKRRKKELKRKRKEAAKKRKERERARRKAKEKTEVADEWDKALEDTYAR